MFNSKGWQLFNEEVKETLEDTIKSAPDACQDNDQWQFRRGEIFKLRQFAGYEDFTRACLAQLEEEEDAQL